MDDKSKLVEVTIVFCFSRPHLIIISFLLFLYSVAALIVLSVLSLILKIMGCRQAVRHRTLNPALRWSESSHPSYVGVAECRRARLRIWFFIE